MSKLAFSGNENGSGIFTIAAPNSDTDRTITLPDAGGTILTSGSFITVDETNGRLGIGTSNSPSNKNTVTPTLNVSGSGVAGSAQITRHTSVGAGGALLHLSATRGSDVNSYTVLQSGDGIGTLVFQGADGGEFVAGAEISAAVDGTPGDDDMPTRLMFKTTADGASSVTERMRIDSSGNVGIGTTNPDALLDIEGPSATQYINATSGNANTFYQLAGTLTGSIEIGGGDSFYLTANNASGSMIFRTGGTNERMRIHSSGVVSVNSASVVGAERFGVKYDGSTVNGIGIETTSSAAGAGFMVFRNEGGSAIGTISRNGGTNAVSYNTTSDYRLKENITPLTNALDRVSALNPVQWTWKDCDGAVGEGFIAHEVQAVAPLAVTGEKDAVDSEGNIKPQGMDSSYLVALLTKAIQEQQQTIESLEARITALET